MKATMGEATQIREIFTTWTYANETNNPEMIFESKLKTNPTHPFIPLSEKKGTFVHKKRSRKILAGVLTIIVAVAIFVTVYLTQNGSLQGVGASIYSIPALVGLWGILLVFLNLEMLTYVIDHSKGSYEFYKGSTLVYRGDLHNVYVRLRRLSTGVGDHYYDITFNGFMIEEMILSEKSRDSGAMDRLARRLAHRLHVNYFDVKNKSRAHYIRHRCPYKLRAPSDSSSTNTEFSV